MSEIQTFIDAPTAKALLSFKKSDIIKIAQHYSLETKTSMVKQTLVNTVAQHIVDEQLGGEDFIKLLEPNKGSEESVKIKELELEITLSRLAIEKSRAALELEQQKSKSALELEQEKSKSNHQSSESSVMFEPYRVCRLVPPFSEDEVDQYFTHFEKVAQNLAWPKECWPTLLQTVFKGKARQAYNDLSHQDSQDYDTVKLTVLKSYELVPEAYRQKFRACQMSDGDSHVEFMRSKERLLDKWVNSKNANDLEKFRQLMLLEELKQCVHPAIKVYLDEQDVSDIYEAAEKADSYSLTHKLSTGQNHNNFNNKSLHNHTQYHSTNQRTQPEVKQGTERSTDKPAKYCNYCKKPGHLEVNCYIKSRNDDYKPKPALCIVCPKHTPLSTPKHPSQDTLADNTQRCVDNKFVKYKYNYDDVEKDFRPFISNGYVSSIDGKHKTSIRILRDTGAARSLLLQGAVELSDSSYTGESAIIHGVGIACTPLPLHNIQLECDLISGPVTVGILPRLPCEGISLLLGNDLVGAQVHPHPIVQVTPLTEIDQPEMYHVIKRSTRKRIEQSENVDVLDGLQNTFLDKDSELVDTQMQSRWKEQIITDQQYDVTVTSSNTKIGMYLLVYATREAVLEKQWLSDEIPRDMFTYETTSLQQSQQRLKSRDNVTTTLRMFDPGDGVCIFPPVPGQQFSAKFYGPFEIKPRQNEFNYIVKTSNRHKSSQLYHIGPSMIKAYHSRESEQAGQVHVGKIGVVVHSIQTKIRGDRLVEAKDEFCCQSTVQYNYIGHVLVQDLIKTETDKMEAIVMYSVLKDKVFNCIVNPQTALSRVE